MYISPIEVISSNEYNKNKANRLSTQQIVSKDSVDDEFEFMSLYDFYARKETQDRMLYVKMGMQIIDLIEIESKGREAIGKVCQYNSQNDRLDYFTHKFVFHPTGTLFLPTSSVMISGFLTASSSEYYLQGVDIFISEIQANE